MTRYLFTAQIRSTTDDVTGSVSGHVEVPAGKTDAEVTDACVAVVKRQFPAGVDVAGVRFRPATLPASRATRMRV